MANILGPYKGSNGRAFLRIQKDGKWTSVNYSRYLMEQAGFDLEGKEVHHIDGDKTNDDLANLCVVDIEAHKVEHGKLGRAEVECTECSLSYSVLRKDYNKNIKRGSKFFCSTKCRSTHTARNMKRRSRSEGPALTL
jgi:hypothetical protein